MKTQKVLHVICFTINYGISSTVESDLSPNTGRPTSKSCILYISLMISVTAEKIICWIQQKQEDGKVNSKLYLNA